MAALALLTGCADTPERGGEAAAKQLELGRRAWRQGDYEAAVPPLKSAAAQGEVRALYALGYLYFYGRGVPQDRARGIEMIRRAAKAGDALAIEALGMMADARSRSEAPAAGQSPGADAGRGGTAAGEGTGHEAAAIAAGAADGAQAAAAAPGNPPETPMVDRESVAAADESHARWLAQRDPQHFTIELLAVRDRTTVQRYRDLYLTRSPPPEPVQVVEVVRRGRRWLLLVMGDYPDRDAAKAGIERLPPLLKAAGPEPRRFSSLTASGPEAALGGR